MRVRDGDLRHADKERLRTVVTALQSGGHFVIVVLANEASFFPAKEFLEQELDEAAMRTFDLRTAEEVMHMLAAPEAHRDVLVFLRLVKDSTGAMAALNLHRDKLRSRPCRFVLWLEGVEGQARFADHAPDCYSVREALAFVEGQRSLHAAAEQRTSDVGTGKIAVNLESMADLRTRFRVESLFFKIESALNHGDIRRARRLLLDAPRHWWDSRTNQFCMADVDARVLRHEGHWEQAEAVLQKQLDAAILDKQQPWVDRYLVELASLLADRAEFDEALGLLHSLESSTPDQSLLHSLIELQCANPEAIEKLRGPLVDKLPLQAEVEHTLKLVQAKAEGIRSCVDAGFLPPARADELVVEVDELAAYIQTTFSPQWCIPAAILGADVRLARRGTEKQARTNAERALALARDTAPEMIPFCVRRIGLAMLRTGDDLSSLDALLLEALDAASNNNLPAEAARLRGLRLWLAHSRGEALAELEEALETAFQRCGSVLVEAEILYQIGRGMNRPALLERARRIYRRLPWPAREIACLEALGKTEMAKTRGEQFGLRLLLLGLERRTEPPPMNP